MASIEFKNISKIFGDCVACEDVSISIAGGNIHSIIGENGAGKSTLVKMLGGLYAPTSGEMFLNGKAYAPRSPQDAFAEKIAFIHQHFVLAEQLSALDNLYLSYTSSRSALSYKNLREVRELAEKILKKFNWQINLDAPVSQISVGEQQRLEILKALLQEPDIVIFDEPTAVLTPQESDDLLKFILQLKSEGKTIILISHKLNEIQSVSDKISVLRRGRHIDTRENKNLSIDQMAELMIGRQIVKTHEFKRPDQLKTLFQITGTQINLNSNEILGVAGIEGNGQSQLIRNLIHDFQNNNLSYGDITEDRIKLSVFDEFNLAEHMLLKHADAFTYKGIVDEAKLTSETQKLVDKWDVRPNNEAAKPLAEYSGGNQQKFVVGRELWNQPDVILAAHPSRGVDLGAQEMIHRSLIEFSQADKAVVLISSDLNEVLTLSDRFVILNKKKVYGPFKRGELNEMQIGIIMAAQSISAEVPVGGSL
jgi:ABC-type uncharacterized transport system ATPase subunit